MPCPDRLFRVLLASDAVLAARPVFLPDMFDVRPVRDDSRNVQIKHLVVKNPEILITPSDSNGYQMGIDIMHSQLAMKSKSRRCHPGIASLDHKRQVRRR